MDMPALSPVIQAQFKGVRVCGTRGGLPFVDAERVELNGKCPHGTAACSMDTTAENTVCYPAEEHSTKCPITSINVMGENEAKAYDSPQAAGKFHTLRLDGDHTLVYGTSANSLPITSVKVENQPCADPKVVSSGTSTKTLPNEIMAG